MYYLYMKEFKALSFSQYVLIHQFCEPTIECAKYTDTFASVQAIVGGCQRFL